LATPICLDESLSTTRRVQDALRYGACAVACLKPSRLGGVFATQVAQAACATAGVPAFVGGFFECGLGRTVNASLAALPGFSLPGDLSAPGSYLVEDPFDYPAPLDGRVALHRGPGVAPPPDPDRLERWSEPGRTLWVPYKGPG
jgi:O-succinylbenzoate synthase